MENRRKEISLKASRIRWKKNREEKAALASQIQEYYESIKGEINKLDLGKKFGLSYAAIRRMYDNGLLTAPYGFRKVVSPETKKKISEIKKKWLKENPDKHPWKKSNKFKSVPCEKAKNYLTEKGISFIEEFSPNVDNTFYSIDIAFPDKMIGVEINGNQHYERNGRLKSYYQKRRNILEGAGWKMYDIHYSLCFSIEKLESIFEKVLAGAEIKNEFDYNTYSKDFGLKCDIPLEELKTLVWEKSLDRIAKQYNLSPWIIKRVCIKNKIELPPRYYWNKFSTKKNICPSKCPPKEELEELIWKIPTTHVAEKYGVSDKAVEKWCKKLGISKPPRGHWAKLKKLNKKN